MAQGSKRMRKAESQTPSTKGADALPIQVPLADSSATLHSGSSVEVSGDQGKRTHGSGSACTSATRRQ